jgi:hypothetical protein
LLNLISYFHGKYRIRFRTLLLLPLKQRRSQLRLTMLRCQLLPLKQRRSQLRLTLLWCRLLPLKQRRSQLRLTMQRCRLLNDCCKLLEDRLTGNYMLIWGCEQAFFELRCWNLPSPESSGL